ncbi:helix-turn-helix domain-containing protein [Actinoplanes sp. NPDC049802]|uniref:TetR/AcrR family transcriptional regulator n=1 Tax=Actinoplanes sp. NPDC049802 TaxID=3154742 RepID=UPI0033DCEDE2
MDTEATGRRARNMLEKRERIVRAAAELFAERGFEGVTTQEISERADVAAGTLFRYAASKGELFLMVHNEELRAAIQAGAAAAAAEQDPEKAVIALVEPVMQRARDSRSAAVYQRELLFGPPTERYRAEGLALVGELERRIAERLGGGADAARAARTVFAVLNLLLVQPWTGVHPGADPVEELRLQVAQVVRGFRAR